MEENGCENHKQAISSMPLLTSPPTSPPLSRSETMPWSTKPASTTNTSTSDGSTSDHVNGSTCEVEGKPRREASLTREQTTVINLPKEYKFLIHPEKNCFTPKWDRAIML